MVKIKPGKKYRFSLLGDFNLNCLHKMDDYEINVHILSTRESVRHLIGYKTNTFVATVDSIEIYHGVNVIYIKVSNVYVEYQSTHI